MLKVGIFAPYVRSEITLAAVQIADWLVRCGIEVVFLAEGRIASGIHPVWDRKVRRASRAAVYHWAAGATHLCWFSPNTEAMDAARLVASSNPRKTTRHIFFPHWSNWKAAHESLMRTADRTISLSQAMAQRLDQRYSKTAGNRTWASLSAPASLLFPRSGRLSLVSAHLLVVLTKAIELDIGIPLLQVFDLLLDGHPGLHVTFLLEHSLPRRYRQELRRISRSYTGRVVIVTSPPYYTYVQLARRHDWVYLTSTRHCYGSLLALLASSSVPVICHDVPPAREHIIHNYNGKLISCDLRESPAPVADVPLDEIGLTLDKILIGPEVLLKAMQGNAVAQLQQKQKSFEQFLFKEFFQ